jgi:hypothetical protein
VKGATAALVVGIFIIAIGAAWVLTGGPARIMDFSPPARAPTTIPVPPAAMQTAVTPQVTAATPAPVTPTLHSTTTTIALPTPPEKLVSADEARDHFMDIAYSATNEIERYNFSEYPEPLVIRLIAPDKTDTPFILATIKDFNRASQTVRLSEKIIEERDNENITIMFLPESGLETIHLDRIAYSGPSMKRREFTWQGRPGAKALRATIYINSNLKGDVRNHLIARSLFYNLGVTGETTKYPDSVFFAEDNTNTRLSTADKKAVAILYGTGISQGMTLEDLRKVIYFPET